MLTRMHRSDSAPTVEGPADGGDTVTVEAPTAEEALAEVSHLLGPDAQIVKAGKVARGGVGGFFAQEMVQLVARKRGGDVIPPESPADSPPPRVSVSSDAGASLTEAALKASFSEMLNHHAAAPGGASGGATASAAAGADPDQPAAMAGSAKERVIKEAFAEFHEPRLKDLAGTESPEEFSARSIIRARTAPDTIAGNDEAGRRASRPMQASEGPAATTGQAIQPGTGRVDWSQDELVHIGLPFVLIEATTGLDPSDDLAWISALAVALRPFCGALREGDSVVVGPKAHHIAGTLGFPDVRYPKAPPRATSACITLPGHKTARAWLAEHRGERSLHLVVGGAGSKALMDLDAAVVSWVGDDALVAALWLSVTRGAVLGYGKPSAGRVLKADPVEVALAIRALVGRR